MLVDAAAMFGAVRQSMRKARRSIFIVGWDIHSRTRLVGEDGAAHDGLPVMLGDFLCALVERNPDLNIYLLLWDYSLLYAMERELFPQISLAWKTPRRVHFCLDRALSVGSSQHQKIVVIDDEVAFSGGLDLTIRRWDTSDHRIDNPYRVDPAGIPYRPFHDVQAVVDGAAALALAQIVRERWDKAHGGTAPAIARGDDAWPDDVWPEGVTPDFTGISVGIARTQPAAVEGQEIREAERLFLDSIAQAERCIYVENQFLTSELIATQLARELERKPALEIVLVAPGTHESWIESHTMRNGRIRFRKILESAGAPERYRMVYPQVRQHGQTVNTMIHSKVMIVDDKLLRIGSANMNNRSMGADTECDLVFEARSEPQRRTMRRLRDQLIAEHCGAKAEDVSASMTHGHSLVSVVDQLSRNGHRLCAIEDGEPDPEELAAYIEEIADPPRPLSAREALRGRLGGFFRSPIVRFSLLILFLIALTLAWRWTPLADYAHPRVVQAGFARIADNAWAPLLVIGAFVLGGLIAFPLTIMIAATAAAFGPWWGLLYAGIGAMLSAAITYALGTLLGRDALRGLIGPRLMRVRQRLARRGVLAIAAIRLVPVAPFTVVNLAAGASEIKLADYLLGTALGLAPGLIVMAALGQQVMRILTAPSLIEVSVLIAAVLAWIGLSFGVQALIARRESPLP